MCEQLEEVRQAIEHSGKSRYRTAQKTGISESQLSKLMSGTTGVSVSELEMLLRYLGYQIDIKKTRTRKR